MESVPFALPAVLGVNLAVKDVFCPAPMVNGVESPLKLKPGPETFTADTVALAFPELVRVTVIVPLFPTRTLPKLRFVGLTESAA